MKEEIYADKEECEKAADALYSAFTWSETPEGHGFWQAIVEHLYALSRDEQPENLLVKLNGE